jgi:hypothetical protein
MKDKIEGLINSVRKLIMLYHIINALKPIKHSFDIPKSNPMTQTFNT